MADKSSSPAKTSNTKSNSDMEKKKKQYQKMLEWQGTTTKDVEDLQKAIAARKPIFPTGSNGRVEGRKLIKWDPHVNEVLLLCIQYECHKQGIELPWDDIAMRLASEKNSSGASIVQHLNKRRKELLEAGCWVTPPMVRKNSQVLFDVRGIVKTGPKAGDIRYISWFEDASGMINPKDIEESRARGGPWNVIKQAYPDEHYPTTRAELEQALKDDDDMRKKLGIPAPKVSCRPSSADKGGNDSDSDDSGPVSKRRRSEPKTPLTSSGKGKSGGNGKSTRRNTDKSDDEFTGGGSRSGKRTKQGATEKRSTRVRTNKSTDSTTNTAMVDEDEAVEETISEPSKIVVLKMSPEILKNLSTGGSGNVQPQGQISQSASEMDIDGPVTDNAPLDMNADIEMNNTVNQVNVNHESNELSQVNAGSDFFNNALPQYGNAQFGNFNGTSDAYDQYQGGAGFMNPDPHPFSDMDMGFDGQGFMNPSPDMNYEHQDAMMNSFLDNIQRGNSVEQDGPEDASQAQNVIDDGIPWDDFIDFSNTYESAPAAESFTNNSIPPFDGAADNKQHDDMGCELMRRAKQPSTRAQPTKEMVAKTKHAHRTNKMIINTNVEPVGPQIYLPETVDPRYLTLRPLGPGDAGNVINAMGSRMHSRVNFGDIQLPFVPKPYIDPHRIGLTKTSNDPTLFGEAEDPELEEMRKMQLKYPGPATALPLPSSHMDLTGLQLYDVFQPGGQYQTQISPAQRQMEDEEFLRLAAEMDEKMAQSSRKRKSCL